MMFVALLAGVAMTYAVTYSLFAINLQNDETD